MHTIAGRSDGTGETGQLTNTAGEDLLVVDVTLDPSHQVFDVFGRGHLGGSFEVLGVLPEVFESEFVSHLSGEGTGMRPARHTHRWLSSRDKIEANRTP
jgi:hypothetical protein